MAKWTSPISSIRPVPSDTDVVQTIKKKPLSKWHCFMDKYGVPLSGLVYIAVSLFGSIKFWTVSQETLANDMLWIDYNATASGFYLAEIFSQKIHVDSFDRKEIVDLTNEIFGSFEDLSKPRNPILFSSTYARFIKYNHLTNLMQVAKSLQHDGKLDSGLLFNGFTQYCWVDFERRWSIAHTVKREKRCLEKEKENAAVYLETYLRNMKWQVFETTWGKWFHAAIGNALFESKEGQAFLKSIQNPNLSIEEEVAYWQKNGLRYHQTQWHTNYETSIIETFSIENVLGLKHNITTKSTSYTSTWSQTTTHKMHWGLLNDLWALVDNHTEMSGKSLVRNTLQFYENYNFSMEKVMLLDQVVPFPLTPIDQILRDTLGPFGSIDMRPITFPSSFYRLVTHFRQVLLNILRAKNNLKAREIFEQIPLRVSFSFVPSIWRQLEEKEKNMTFLGGNPLCSKEVAVPYVTQMFRFDSNCDTPNQMVTSISRTTMLLIYLVNSLINKSDNSTKEKLSIDQAKYICHTGITDTNVEVCIKSLVACHQFTQTIMTQEQRATLSEFAQNTFKELVAENIELMQYAKKRTVSNETETLLLRHPVIISKEDSTYTQEYAQAWNLFGWFYSYEWFLGRREVVSFEGDEGTMVLLSSGYTTKSVLTSKDERLPSNMSSYMLWVVQYITIVLISLAIVVLFYALGNKLNIEGSNFFKFSRVTGAVWIGRPLLVVRGLVAISMLSSTHLELVKDGQLTYLTERTPNWFQNIVTASEACWITYALNDALKIFTHGITHKLASRSSRLTWIIVAIFQLVVPTSHQATMELKCEYTKYEVSIVCTSGNVQVGSFSRFLTVICMSIGSVIVCYFLTIWFTTEDSLQKKRKGCTLLLPGIAQEVFENSNWLHQDEWHLDTASAAIAGLLTIRYRQWSRILDVKTWSLLHLRDGLVLEYADDQILSSQEEKEYFATRPSKLKHTLRLAALKSK